MDMMEYKDYRAKIQYSDEDEIFFGEVIGLCDKLIFEGNSPAELKEQFRICVDDYLEMCAALGKEPEKEFKGSLNIRITPEIHRQLFLSAQAQGISLNKLMNNLLAQGVQALPGLDYHSGVAMQ